VNILILGAMDCSGAGHVLMTAINEHTDHEARMIATRQVRYHYPVDIINPPEDEARSWVEWADVLNLHVRGEDLIPDGSPARPAVKTYHGSEYRKLAYAKEENDKAQVNDWLQVCMTADLTIHGAKWIGRAVPDLSHMLDQDDGFHLAHAAAPDRKGKRDRKGTDVLETALEELDGVTADIFREVSNTECLERKAKAHLYIDQVGARGNGYGTNALEAWALGLPVVASAPAWIKEAIVDQVGYLPFCPSDDARTGYDDVRELRQRIEQFRDSAGFCQKWTKKGRRYVRYWHDPCIVAEKYVKLFERIANA